MTAWPRRLLANLQSGLLRLGQTSWPATTVLVLALAAGLITLRGIDAALAAMHLPGAVAGSATKTAGVASLLDPARAQAVVMSWHDWADLPASDEFLSPTALIGGYVTIDILFVAVPLTLLLLRVLSKARRDAIGHEDDYPLKTATATVAANATLPAFAYFLADVAEDTLLMLAVTNGATRAEATLLGMASLLKWTALVLAVVPWLLARLAYGMAGGVRWRGLTARARDDLLVPLIILRAQVLTVVGLAGLLLALQGDLGRQVQDVLLGLPEQLDHEAIALAGVAGFAFLTYVTGRACQAAYEAPPGGPQPAGPIQPATLWFIGVTGLTIGSTGVYLAVAESLPFGWFFVPIGVLLVTFSVLSALRDVRSAWVGGDGLKSSPTTAAWLKALVLIPLAAFGLVALQGAVTLTVVQEFGKATNLLVFMALLAGAAIGLPALSRLWELPQSMAASNLRKLAIGASVATVVVIGVWAAVDPWAAGERFGTTGIMLAFLATVLLAMTGLVVVGDKMPARGALAMCRLRRMPLVTLALICFVATSYLDTKGRYNDVRLLATQPLEESQQLTVSDAFAAWLADHPASGDATEKRRVPMVFIATAGGGIRAAYWTSTVLDCLFGPPEQCDAPAPAGSAQLPAGSSRMIFAASGISGGSVGLAAFRAVDDGAESARLIFEDQDFVAPVLAALAFRDAPNALVHADPDWLDRAGVLEIAWERAAAERGRSLSEGFATSSFDGQGNPRFPLLILNGAAVEDGCRVTVSVLDTAPADEVSCVSLAPFEGQPATGPTFARTRDALDYTCGTGDTALDLRLSTAALLSARFPYVSPSGGITSCTNPARRTFVLDGGLIDSSGASPLVELWSTLSPLVQAVNMDPTSGLCLDPRLILIDNGYADVRLNGLPRRPQELVAPLQAQNEAAGSTTAAARQAAAIAFQATLARQAACRQPDGELDPPDITEAVAHFYPRLHPGPLAPLGWTLSNWAEDELRGQIADNASQIARVRTWFS